MKTMPSMELAQNPRLDVSTDYLFSFWPSSNCVSVISPCRDRTMQLVLAHSPCPGGNGDATNSVHLCTERRLTELPFFTSPLRFPTLDQKLPLDRLMHFRDSYGRAYQHQALLEVTGIRPVNTRFLTLGNFLPERLGRQTTAFQKVASVRGKNRAGSRDGEERGKLGGDQVLTD